MTVTTTDVAGEQLRLPHWVPDSARERDLTDLGIKAPTVTATLGAPHRLTVGMSPDELDTLIALARRGQGPTY